MKRKLPMPYKLLCLTALTAAIHGCAMYSNDARPGYTIGDLPDARLPPIGREVPEADTAEIVDNYLEVLEVAEDEKVRRHVATRLADLEMTRSEDELVEGTSEELTGLFSTPISMYETLLDDPAEDQDTERLLYQLSKAYALDGQSDASNQALERLVAEYPDSKFAAEAEFRLAERAFSQSDYDQAKYHYGSVVALGEETDYYQNGLYMLGWSEFKLNRYQPALTSFVNVLDLLFDDEGDLTNLTNTQRNLAEDTLRVMSIAFSYLGGAESIRETNAVLGERAYTPLLYENLGDLYSSQERYRDAADTYLAFVEEQPYSALAPEFSVKAIQTYYDGNFPSLILPAKEEFVMLYGIRGSYWGQAGAEAQENLKPYLREYLEELATFNHASAQDSSIEMTAIERNTAYVTAAEFYREFIATFPADPKVAETAFLMGEAYYAANVFDFAADAYEKVAYDYPDSSQGADAGYNAILSIDKHLASLDELSAQPWRERKIESSIRYADTYPMDERATGVLTAAANILFESEDSINLTTAIELSRRITLWEPAPEQQYLRSAWLIIGHGEFELGNFVSAETAYQELLAILPPEDALIPEIKDRIAASMYRQSEELVASGATLEAIDKLLAVRDISPGSEIAATAHFDAINYLMELEDWDRASQEMDNFSVYYATHPLNAQIPAKQTFVYQETEQWELAAESLLKMIPIEQDPEIRRQSLYLAADLFMQAENTTRAAETYRRYVNNYPLPKEFLMEAYFQLAELETNYNTRNQWLNALVNNAEMSNDRSRYLGAWASAELADQDYERFAALRLTLPLNESLKAKQQALQTALTSYNGVLEYGVAEFTTQASYKIGEIYAELSSAMIDSERPKDLDALALEQYEILLEEQAYPFEDKSIEIHEANVRRSWDGDYDSWVKNSFSALAKLLPGRYNKTEHREDVSRGIH